MPDVHLRFQRDMLVLSAPIDQALARQGVNASLDRQYLSLMEPDSILDALRLEAMAGAQCLVTATEDITQARLAHLRMDAEQVPLAKAALSIVHQAKPQHVLVEIGPCGLPLDGSSKSSLNENRKQYADAARSFGGGEFDAFFLNGFTKIADLKCALMAVAQVSDKPVFASVTIGEGPLTAPAGTVAPAGAAGAGERAVGDDGSGNGGGNSDGFPFEGYEVLDAPLPPPLPASRRTCLDPREWPAAIDAMLDYGAAVVGFETARPIGKALDYAKAAVGSADRPVLAQLHVTGGSAESAGKGLVPLEDIDEYTPDTMTIAAMKLRAAGVQFLRASGAATPAYTGALAATVAGLDVKRA